MYFRGLDFAIEVRPSTGDIGSRYTTYLLRGNCVHPQKYTTRMFSPIYTTLFYHRAYSERKINKQEVYGVRFVWSLLGNTKVVDLPACWQGRVGRHWNGVIWMVAPHCLMWCLWRERNDRSFEDFERTLLDLKLFFF